MTAKVSDEERLARLRQDIANRYLVMSEDATFLLRKLDEAHEMIQQLGAALAKDPVERHLEYAKPGHDWLAAHYRSLGYL